MAQITILLPFSGTATVSEKSSDESPDGADEDDEYDSDEVCEDKISNIAGSLSCKNFLRSFAYQYCRHKYIRKNCCASHKIFCRRGRRARQFRQELQQVPSSEVTTLRHRRRQYWRKCNRKTTRRVRDSQNDQEFTCDTSAFLSDFFNSFQFKKSEPCFTLFFTVFCACCLGIIMMLFCNKTKHVLLLKIWGFL